MSTKIYNGYELPVMGVYELREFCGSVQAEIVKAADEILVRQVADLSALIIDRKAAGLDISGFTKNHGDDSSAVFLAYYYIFERGLDIQRTKHRDPGFDYECTACFFPLEDRILCTFYSERKEFTEIWEAQEKVTEFGYWNNTDRPDGVTQDQWDERGDVWGNALGKTGVPAQEGFVFTFSDGVPMHPKIEKVVEYLPGFDKRVTRTAKEVVVQGKFYGEDAEKVEPEKVFGFLRQIKTYLESEEGKQAVGIEEIRLGDVLVRELDLQELRGGRK